MVDVMDYTIGNSATAAHVYDAQFIRLMIIILVVNVTKCISLERAMLPNYSSDYSPLPQYVILTDSWVSPSLKNTNLDVFKTNKGKLDESTGGKKKLDAEKYKNGNLVNEYKSKKYNEVKQNVDKYNDKKGHNGQQHVHGGKKKKIIYKKGDKHKKFKTKKGFQDKYHKNEKHKVNEFWDNYETYGTFKKFGKKGDIKLEGHKKNNKIKTQKGSKSKKENKKKGKTQNKSGSKSKTGHKKEKNINSHYNNESQYHKEKKNNTEIK